MTKPFRATIAKHTFSNERAYHHACDLLNHLQTWQIIQSMQDLPTSELRTQAGNALQSLFQAFGAMIERDCITLSDVDLNEQLAHYKRFVSTDLSGKSIDDVVYAFFGMEEHDADGDVVPSTASSLLEIYNEVKNCEREKQFLEGLIEVYKLNRSLDK